MLFKISWKNIVDKKLNSFLCILLMTLGIAMISLLMLLGKQLQDKFAKNISGIDLVVGAKGSPLQLILSSVYQIDNPTGNIYLEDVQAIAQNPLVKEMIPLSMGDNFQGYRIVGTNKKYFEHFKTQFESGKMFKSNLEVVLGGQTAANTNLKVGDTFASSHGLDSEGEKHAERNYKVVGVLEFNNSVVDNLILTSLGSVWSIHEKHAEGETHPEEDSTERKEITSAIIKFRSPMGMMAMPRNINQNSKLQAAVPAIEVNRLFELLGIGIEGLQFLAAVIMLISGISVFVSLYNSLKERKYEMALMLSMGASRTRLFLMLLLEGIILSFLGFVAGILLSRIGIYLISNALNKKFHMNVSQFGLQIGEIYLFIGALLVGILAASIPSIGIYRINISKTLATE
ncbi:Macrolide export ATP-binding/permease protein MacB [Emticicia aquatica]|jgi:putative ABC transport system permease protein|uniref:Macrolide export ATP-binding/permease protein MacB n=1 Tax=Emticicia aquatica TaxID=1681835 RepID=A0ABM9AN55_9BACT|nr:FtsX-like permease family protein [Emticicia aquatica]CAH0995255.1 Macrolide export ATP-binding/permease protein MacB [Emticicia aquatica]